MNKQLPKKFAISLIVVLFIVTFLVWDKINAYQDNKLYVYFLDVGQGDAIYMRTPNDQDIIIDGGPDNEVLPKLGSKMPFYDRKIELMFLTHPHEDHVNGLIDILDKYQVEKVIVPAISYESSSFVEWERSLKEHEINVINPFLGQKINLGSSQLEIINPDQAMLLDENVNNASIVIKYTFGETKLILTGDAEADAEQVMIANRKSILLADLLKVGHHGSKTSSTDKFLDLIDPRLAIVSVGTNNKFNHPAQTTIGKLEKRGIEYYRTDYHGTITCVSDAKEVKCEPEKF